MKQNDSYVKLEDKDFLKLISGGQVDLTDPKGNQVHIILADIGWDRMLENFRYAMNTSSQTP